MYTFYAFFWAMFTGSLFILFLHFLLKDTSILLKTGLGFFVLGTALCILRLFTPLEIPFLQYRLEYPGFISELIRPRDFLGTGMPLVYVIIFCLLLVSLILFFRFLLKVRKMERVLRENSEEAHDAEEILHTIDEACPLPVRRTALLSGPVIVGYLHPVIYLPEVSFSRKNLIDILRHEYTHWKRHHLTFKFVLQCITILFWWNPCIYLLRKDMVHLIELICDEVAMRTYQQNEKLHYMATILQCLNNSAAAPGEGEAKDCALGFAAVIGGNKTKQRVTYHLNKTPLAGRKKYQIYLLNGIAICWLLVSYFVILQPFYNPEDVENYSNSENAYLVECQDGSYEFHFGANIVPVSRESVEKDEYFIYPVISYEEYKNLGDYQESQHYQELFQEPPK